ncbi:hypothetical protein Q0F99_03995 [Rathayibacter oskolensis]|uniref:hypothetical protein n=1 Tax=Rathayibacter TaxID=33886 RepID=UPI00131652CC|nr:MULTISPECIES: hypothetical protein [Rathayibacter]QHC67710.1 hypothetical protein GSU68_14805 [Rathayibacter sp. VKM Ac-2759]WKK72186.1 hypothetical protein Q0F99_03995 [Rathayibacter oskolensis]
MNDGQDERDDENEPRSEAEAPTEPEDRDEAAGASPERRAPVVPDNGYSRESYAIHATRSELPLFSSALSGTRDDAGWLSSLSGMLGGGEPDAAATAAESAIERRRRKPSDDA